MLARAPVLAGLLLLAATALAAPSAPAEAPTACFSAPLQDDAGSGRDAGPARASAIPLPAEGTFAGTLGTPLDGEDAYTVDLAGAGETVMMEAYLDEGQYVLRSSPPPTALVVEAWAPDASAPTHRGILTPGGATNVTFENAAPGAWLFRVALLEATPSAPACTEAGAGLAVQTADAPLHDYRFYFGCNPHCLEAA